MHASNSRNWGFETHRYLGRRYDALFLLNPDQRYSFKKDVKPFKANTGNVLVPSVEHLLKTWLKEKGLPMSSAKYMAQQACYYQGLRYIFQRSMEHDLERRSTAS